MGVLPAKAAGVESSGAAVVSGRGCGYVSLNVEEEEEVMDPRSIKRILVPTDFSEASTEAVATALAFARAFGAAVDLVHVAVEATYALPPPVDVATVPIDMTKVMDEVSKHLSAEQERVRATGVPCESTVLIGRPDAE